MDRKGGGVGSLNTQQNRDAINGLFDPIPAADSAHTCSVLHWFEL